ncbi:hypothetical protein LXA43DRAFT_1099092 [Ganoderma leucocontextum]|nr:hypothetical protein LXA43DRAFT_1099092 [Ganoderma leucocontextum]
MHDDSEWDVPDLVSVDHQLEESDGTAQAPISPLSPLLAATQLNSNNTPYNFDDEPVFLRSAVTLGIKTRIQDGAIWWELRGADGELFFDNGLERLNPEELHLGITLSFDGFGYQRSSYAGSYSSGVLSVSFANLAIHLRYRQQNIKLCGLTPGLTEFMADEFHRVCGFADHRNEAGFCPRCEIKHADLWTPEAMSENGFPDRNGAKHCERAHEYQKCADQPSRDWFFKEHSVRYFELSRLPYFDPVRMTVLDPMHNILLGVVKTQWYHVRYPAGGSLGVDEWKCLVMVYCPIVIPLIWEEWYPAAQAENTKKQKKWEKDEAACKARLSTRAAKLTDGDPLPEPQPCMLKDDANNFLKLAATLKIILAHSIRDSNIVRAKSLLYDYLRTLLELHPDCIKPNHHYLTHIFAQLVDNYGPVYGFWTFLFECLNKILKSYSTSGHGGGEIEPQPPRPEDEQIITIIRLLLASDSDTRGTVASLAKTLDEEYAKVNTRYALGFHTTCLLTLSEHADLLEYYNHAHVYARVLSPRDRNSGDNPNFLYSYGAFYEHVFFESTCYVGQAVQIFGHQQQHVNNATESVLLRVRWLCREEEHRGPNPWAAYPELEVYFWNFRTFLPPGIGPPTLIPPSAVVSQACRIMLHHYRADTHRMDDESDGEDHPNARDKPDIPISDNEESGNLVWATIGLTRDIIVV